MINEEANVALSLGKAPKGVPVLFAVPEGVFFASDDSCSQLVTVKWAEVLAGVLRERENQTVAPLLLLVM
ncbi:MAG TPA: hypothetical protein DCR43_01005 [Bacteroidales bacterium]|nr:MAG: hypothetical protein A2X11_14830 [Bacteroidetes bacterium GWE2_42_24]OFY31624.1 MAG: hypothetical protein A2X09_08575 [Bacteroidetes bacterium GWF2_43_11]HAQ64431.1 hypothetical protein [Bacteroidales bacterium]HBZ67119.1 hypothetical protein [Bacteroidales bacterium]